MTSPSQPRPSAPIAQATAGSEQAARLLLFLDLTVPLWVTRVAAWPEDRQIAEANTAADLIAHGADVLFRGAPGSRRGARGHASAAGQPDEPCTGDVLNAIAKGLAIGALRDGGVTFMGCHWCVRPHGGCRGNTCWVTGAGAASPGAGVQDAP